MITEDYVSFETAKLLKEKGFDEKCTHFFKNENYLVDMEYSNYHHVQNHELIDEYTAPTLQMAMKWLREVHHLEIYLEHDAIQENNNWWYQIGKYTKGCIFILHESHSDYPTYEGACETAIKYCLENII